MVDIFSSFLCLLLRNVKYLKDSSVTATWAMSLLVKINHKFALALMLIQQIITEHAYITLSYTYKMKDPDV